MRPTRYLPTTSGLVDTILPLALFVPAFAQKNDGGGGNNNNDGGNNNNNNGGNTGGNNGGNSNNDDGDVDAGDDGDDNSDDTSDDPPPPAPAPNTDDPADDDPPSTDDAETETQPPPPATETNTDADTQPTEPPSSAPESTDPASITNTGVVESTQTDTDIPTITGAPDDSSDGGLTDLPTLTGPYRIPTYAPPAIPPTKDAPFMQHSSAPDGTVFIAVGAILGAFGLAILLWRAITSILLHRSVKRAAMAQHDSNAKTGFPAPPAPFYKYTDHGSNMSVTGAAAAGKSTRRTNRGPIPSSNPSQSNLFFSPTAAASNNGGNRGSAFLPSGFYAAGSGSPAQAHGHSISLTNLRPDSRGRYANASHNTLDPTPPDSPSFNPRRDMSSTSLNLNRPPTERAPSAYLDDLLADDPGSLPPPHMPPSNGIRHPSTRSGNSSPAPRH